MTILVDEIRAYATPLRNKQWCHMMSDDLTDAGLEELHAMAQRIGLKREWFQNKPRFPHYDLTPRRRGLAIQHGAQAVEAQDLVRRCARPVVKP